jgi:hypothetical protein
MKRIVKQDSAGILLAKHLDFDKTNKALSEGVGKRSALLHFSTNFQYLR